MNIPYIEPSNIVAINPDHEKELEILMAERKHRPCSGIHKQIEVDSDTRTIICTACKTVVDPFEYLETWAREGERKMDGLKGIDAKCRVAANELAQLLKRIDSIRGQLKRAGHPQTQLERAEFKNEMSNAGYRAQTNHFKPLT